MTKVSGTSLLLSLALLSGCGWTNISMFEANPSLGPIAEKSGCDLVEVDDSYDVLGTGTALDPHLLCNASQFASIGKDPAALSLHFKLASDIDLSAYDGSTSDLTLIPIGSYDYVAPIDSSVPFTGSFDGAGHTLSNAKLINASGFGVGVFGYLSSATVKNLTLTGLNIQGEGYVGGLVAYSKSSRLSNIHAAGVVLSTAPNSGGIVAYNDGSGVGNDASLDLLSSQVDVQTADAGGGIVGWNTAINGGKANLSNLVYSGTLTQAAGVGNSNGGLVGYSIANAGGIANISNGLMSGTVIMTNNGSFSGGAIGTITASGIGSVANVDRVRTTGNVTLAVSGMFHFAGGGVIGLLGCSSSAECRVTKSAFSGVLNLPDLGVNQNGVGAFLGEYQVGSVTTSVEDSYAVGTFTVGRATSTGIGGFFGNIDNLNVGQVMARRCYSSVAITGSGATLTGALVGNISHNAATAENTFWNSTLVANGVATASLKPVTAGITGLSSAASLLQASYTGFDFSNIWSIASGVVTPALR